MLCNSFGKQKGSIYSMEVCMELNAKTLKLNLQTTQNADTTL